MRRLRIVTMVDRLMTSGGETVATRIAMNLDPARFESVLVSTRPSDPRDVAYAESAGIRVVTLERRSRLDLLGWLPLLELLRRERVDVLHAHKFGSNLWAAVLSPLARVPVLVTHEHTWSYVGQPLRKLLDRELIARRADAFVTVSPEDRRRVIELERVDPSKVRYVRNGIPALPPGDGAAFRRSLGIEPGVPLVGTICSLRAQKAIDVLLQAVAQLRTECPDVRVIIVGDGPERAALERLVDELGLQGTVEFLGARRHEELPGILAGLDVAVLSSRYEGMPLSLIEWMAAGKAIVATRVGGVPALVEHGIHGLLVEPDDASALAQAVVSLLSDAPRRLELGSNAAARQRAAFDLDHMVRSLESLYESLYWSSSRGRQEATRAAA